MMSGLPTQTEREQVINDLQEMIARIIENHLERDTLMAVQAAMIDFARRYEPFYYPAER